MTNFDHVRKGREDNTFVFSVENGRDRTSHRAITIVLPESDGEYMGVKTSGRERLSSIQKMPLLWEKSAKPSATGAAPANVTTGLPNNDGRASGNASNQSKGFADKGSENSPTAQEVGESHSILTELRTSQGNVLVNVAIGKGEDIDFNIVRSTYGKSDDGVVKWINEDRLLYTDKERTLDFLHDTAPIAGTERNQELYSATKLVENFENPAIWGEKVGKTTEIGETRPAVRGEVSDERLSELHQFLDNADKVIKENQSIFGNARFSTPREAYHRLAGEVEARNVSGRMGMTDEQRRQSLATDTEDVPRDEQIVRFGNGVSMSERDIAESITRAKRDAERMPEPIAFTKENWDSTFPAGKVDTPIGEVSLGEHQFEKMRSKGRSAEVGLMKATLERPDFVIEENTPQEGAQRQSNYLFVKTFVKDDGSTYRHYESVTISRDGSEVVISSHYISESKLRKALKDGELIYYKEDSQSSNGSEMRLAETQDGRSDLLPTPDDNESFAGKGSENSPTVQEGGENRYAVRGANERQKIAGSGARHLRFDVGDVDGGSLVRQRCNPSARGYGEGSSGGQGVRARETSVRTAFAREIANALNEHLLYPKREEIERVIQEFSSRHNREIYPEQPQSESKGSENNSTDETTGAKTTEIGETRPAVRGGIEGVIHGDVPALGAENKRLSDERKAAVKAVTSLRGAMSKQRAYDRGTVKLVTDLASDLMARGLLDRMAKNKHPAGRDDSRRRVRWGSDVMARVRTR